MQDAGCRHPPVVAGGKVVGVISRGDFRGLEQARLDDETGLWERIGQDPQRRKENADERGSEGMNADEMSGAPKARSVAIGVHLRLSVFICGLLPVLRREPAC